MNDWFNNYRPRPSKASVVIWVVWVEGGLSINIIIYTKYPELGPRRPGSVVIEQALIIISCDIITCL